MGQTSLIHELIDALQKQRIFLSEKELTDVFWLAARLPLRAPEPEKKPGDKATSPIEPNVDPSETKVEPGRTTSKPPETPTGERGEGVDSRGSAAGQVYTTRRRDAQAAVGKRGVPLRAPAAPALPHPLELERAFRPLMRRVPSRAVEILDEDATVERIAEQRIWVTETRPARERWFEVALIVDAALSMAVWKPTLDELRLLLERHGAFRDVRVWRMNTHAPGALSLSAGPGRASHPPDELNEPYGRRLILLASDGVGDGWHDGRVKQLLEDWARRGPLAVVQMLPLSLWRQTGLAASPVVTVRAAGAGLPSALLEVVDRRRRYDSVGGPKPVPIPVFTLEPEVVREWANLTARAGGDTATALLLETWEPEPAEAEAGDPELTNAEDRLESFDAIASPLARELAGLFAATPLLRLPVLRMVQREMLPESGQTELAEVVLGGLLRATNPAADSDELEFEFYPGVRDQLLDSILVTDAIEVYNAASRYVEGHLGQFRDFQAIIEDPTGKAAESLALEDKPFAAIHAKLLRRLGGHFAEVAENLERVAAAGLSTTPDTVPIPATHLNQSAHLSNSYASRRRILVIGSQCASLPPPLSFLPQAAWTCTR